MTGKRYLTVDDVVELVGHSRSTVYRAIADGDLEASRLTRKRGWRIRPAAIERWMDRCSNQRGQRRSPAPRSTPVEPAASAAARARRGRAPVRLTVTRDMGRRK